MVLDIMSASLCGEAARAIYLELSKEDRNGGNPELVGKLHKALYGTRDAPQQWQEHLSTTLKSIGFREVTCMPGAFQLDQHKVTSVVHVDDIIMVGTESSLRMVQTKLEEIYELKNEILGPQLHHEQEVKYLGRHICWTNRGVTIEADGKHVDQLLHDLGMLDCNSVNSPVTVSPKDDQGELLDVVQARLYRKSAARIAYLSQDRPDLSHASCDLATGMADSTTTDMWRQKRGSKILERPCSCQDQV